MTDYTCIYTKKKKIINNLHHHGPQYIQKSNRPSVTSEL